MRFKPNPEHPLIIIAPEDSLYREVASTFSSVEYFTSPENLIDFFHGIKDTDHLSVIFDLALGKEVILNLLSDFYRISMVTNYIVFDAFEDIDTAVSVYRKGGTLYMKKPNDRDRFDVVFEMSEKKKITQKQFDDTYYLDQLFQNVKIDKLFFTRNDQDSEENYESEALAKQIKQILGQDFDKLPKPKLLIVEDESINMQILKIQLRPYYELLCAASGKECLAILQEHPDIQLILLDVYLPDILGTRLYLEIRKTHALAKVIVFTAFEENEVARELIHAGAYDYINKPYDERELQQKCLTAWRSVRWPFFEFSICYYHLSDDNKLDLIAAYVHQMQDQNKPLYLSDIYSLFPNLIPANQFSL